MSRTSFCNVIITFAFSIAAFIFSLSYYPGVIQETLLFLLREGSHFLYVIAFKGIAKGRSFFSMISQLVSPDLSQG